ncbi:MAG: phospholipid/cholesterol/gamma-HCH transport system substrate-binding protein [Acidobacteriota bacterium]|jgi:phospholipid/cholesterol/gamma-HCH transport system substrate-binding protein|nr:phospholipid/cholesterol/gamma-HCH transport system substrate-binding protein [Acidobacteriota bacterium]
MSSAAKVGAFMLLILGILGFFVLKIEDLSFGRKKTRQLTAIFDNVAGLDEKSGVRVAGVRKGKVTRINTTPDGHARVTLELDDDVQLRTNASASVANLGLLGEKYVEIDPGTPNMPLAQGDSIQLRGSAPASIDDVTSQISDIATDVKAITASLRNVVGGPKGQQRLEDIVDNVRGITEQVRALIAANRANVDATMVNARIVSEQLRREIPQLAASIDRVAQSIGGTVSENRKDVRDIVENLKHLSADLRTTSDNLGSITGQVKSGEGTIGKLIYSDEAHDKLTRALTSVESGVNELRNTLGRASRIGMDVGIKGDYFAGLDRPADEQYANNTSNARAAVQLRIIPNPERNRFYNIELADDPRGSRREKATETTTIDPVTGRATTTITKETKFDRNFLISAQAGWTLQPLSVRIGLIDSTGGVGADYALNDRIRITGEAFDFGKKRDPNPHVRLFGEYVLRKETARTPMIFVSSGIDNALNNTAFTFGGGIRWRDDDLKYLLSSVPLGK